MYSIHEHCVIEWTLCPYMDIVSLYGHYVLIWTLCPYMDIVSLYGHQSLYGHRISDYLFSECPKNCDSCSSTTTCETCREAHIFDNDEGACVCKYNNVSVCVSTMTCVCVCKYNDVSVCVSTMTCLCV